MTTQWVKKKTTRNKNPPRDRAQSSTETCHVHHVRSLHSKPGAGKNCAITAHLLTTLSLQLHQHTPVKKESKNNRKAKPRMKTEHEGNAQVLFGWVKCLKWLQLSRRIREDAQTNTFSSAHQKGTKLTEHAGGPTSGNCTAPPEGYREEQKNQRQWFTE